MDNKRMNESLGEEVSPFEDRETVNEGMPEEPAPEDVGVEAEPPRKPQPRSRRGGKPKEKERAQLIRERPEPLVNAVEAQPVPLAREKDVDEEARADALERRKLLQEKLDAVEVAREEYEEAKDELTRKVKELRMRIRRRELVGKELDRETDRMVGRFRETEAGQTLKKLLPDRAGAATFSDKLRRIITMALDLPYWSEPGFNQRYRKKFGSEVVEDFDEQERSIMDDLLDATVEEESEKP